MLNIAYSGKSKPSALKIAEELGVDGTLKRSTSAPTDVNWGRNRANSTLNPDISNVTNKRRMRELFAEHGVPTPELLASGELNINEVRDWVFPVVGRPDQHTKCRGFWKCNTFGEVLEAYRGRRRKKAATHFMKYVEHDREYRVHIFKGRSIRISEKAFTEDGKYTTKKPGEIRLRKVREAARRAVEAVGLDFGAVDILASGEDNSQVWVTEVNAAPGLGGTMPKLYADTFKRWQNGEFDEE